MTGLLENYDVISWRTIQNIRPEFLENSDHIYLILLDDKISLYEKQSPVIIYTRSITLFKQLEKTTDILNKRITWHPWQENDYNQ